MALSSGNFAVQLINSTIIRELSTIFFFPAAYIWFVFYPGAYKWGASILGAYIRGVYIPRGIYPGGLSSGGF